MQQQKPTLNELNMLILGQTRELKDLDMMSGHYPVLWEQRRKNIIKRDKLIAAERKATT